MNYSLKQILIHFFLVSGFALCMSVCLNIVHAQPQSNSVGFVDQSKPFSVKSTPLTEAKKSFLSDRIPKNTVFAFGYEPRWDDSNSEGTSDWTLVKKVSQEIHAKVERAYPNWTEEEKQAWTTISSLPFPQTEAELGELGIRSSSAFWVYGLGMIPALVVEITDPQKLKTWASKNLQSINHGFKEVHHHQGNYWRREMKRWVLLVRLHENILHMSLLPKRSEPILLSYFLRNRQAESLSSELMESFKGLPKGARGSGLIKVNHLINMIFGSQKPLLKHSGTALGLPMPILDACAPDFRRFATTFQTLSFGLKKTTQQQLNILTQIHLETKLQSQLAPSFKNLMPTNLQKRSLDSGSLSLRLNTGALLTFIRQTLEFWQSKPWTCSLFSSLNAWPQMLSTPEFMMLSGFLSELKGLSVVVHKSQNTKTPLKSNQKQQTMSTLAQPNFELWAEILHSSPQLLLNMTMSLLQLPKLPSDYYHLDGQLKTLGFLGERLKEAKLSLSEQKLMFSLGKWGERKHQSMLQNKEEKHHEQPALNPFLQFALPPMFSSWLKDKLDAYQSKVSPSLAKKPLLKSSEQLFRSLELYFTQQGVLLEVHVDVPDALK